jgi:hypothetical protein
MWSGRPRSFPRHGRSLIPSALLDARRYLRKPQAPIEGDIRFFSSNLLFLALVRLRSVHVGRRVIKTCSNPDALANLPLKALMLVTGIVAVGLALFGAIHVPSARLSSRYLISVFLGLLGVADVRRDWQFLANPRPTPMAWWYQHMGCMLGAGIAFHTTFIVFGAHSGSL